MMGFTFRRHQGTVRWTLKFPTIKGTKIVLSGRK